MRMSQPGPHGQASVAPWRRWLFPVALMASAVTLLAVAGSAPRGVPLTYTQFVADVGAGMVRAVTIGPAGQVSGSLAGGHLFTTTIPVALGGNSLAADLTAHHVQVSATTGMSSPLLSVVLLLLPLLLVGGLLFMFVRTTRRQAGGLGGGWAGRPGWRRPRHESSPTSARPPGSRTWPATRQSRPRSPRSSSTCATPPGTTGPGLAGRAAC